MPRTADRPDTERATRDREMLPDRVIPHEWDRRHGIERWVRWMAFAVFAILALSVGLWAWLADGGEPAAAEYPDCWPLCSYAATAAAAPIVEAPATPAEYPDCWPLCSYAATAAAAPVAEAQATPAEYPDCWPLCSYVPEPVAYPDCWPLCSYVPEPVAYPDCWPLCSYVGG